MYFFRELLNQNRSVQNAFDDKSLLKLIFTTRPERCTVALGTSTCCQLQPSSHSLSGLSPTRRWVGTRALGTRLLSFFFTFGKGKVRVHYSKQLIMKCRRYINKVDFLWESVDWVRNKFPFCPHWENARAFPPGTKKTVRNNEVSVLSGCP